MCDRTHRHTIFSLARQKMPTNTSSNCCCSGIVALVNIIMASQQEQTTAQQGEEDNDDNATDDKHVPQKSSSLASRRGVAPLKVMSASNAGASPPRVTPSTTASTASTFPFPTSRRGMYGPKRAVARSPTQQVPVGVSQPSMPASYSPRDQQQVPLIQHQQHQQQQVPGIPQHLQSDIGSPLHAPQWGMSTGVSPLYTSPWSMDYAQISSSVTSIETALAIGRQALRQSRGGVRSSTNPPGETEASHTIQSVVEESASQQQSEKPAARTSESATEPIQESDMNVSRAKGTEVVERVAGRKRALSVKQDEAKESVVSMTPTRSSAATAPAVTTPPPPPRDSAQPMSSGRKRKQRREMPPFAPHVQVSHSSANRFLKDDDDDEQSEPEGGRGSRV